MGNVLADALIRLEIEEYKRKKDEHNVRLAALKAEDETKREQMIAGLSKNKSTNDVKGSTMPDTFQPSTWDNNERLFAQRLAVKQYMDTVGYQDMRQAGKTKALVDALHEAERKRDTGRGYAPDTIDYRETSQTSKSNALVEALLEAELRLGTNTDNVYSMGTQPYTSNDPTNYVDLTGHNYQTDLAVSVEKIHEYFNSIGDAGNILVSESLNAGNREGLATITYPLPDDLVTEQGFVIPSCENCYTYLDDGRYAIGYRTPIFNILAAGVDSIPFAYHIRTGCTELLSDHEYIQDDDFGFLIDALSILKDSDLIIGDYAKIIGNAMDLYDIVRVIFDDGPETNQMTANLFGDRIYSSTREGCLIKYYIYYNITKKAIDSGMINYSKTNYGTIRTIDQVDWNGIRDIMIDTGIDFTYLDECYR